VCICKSTRSAITAAEVEPDVEIARVEVRGLTLELDRFVQLALATCHHRHRKENVGAARRANSGLVELGDRAIVILQAIVVE
jgi:hypothetical protein